jgi:ADP-L-glycero-D-manno-heptose 6-epimerase
MIVVTGGAGFIGSCFVKKLNEHGVDDILIVDSFGTSDKWKNLVGKNYIAMMEKNMFLDFLNSDDSSDIQCVVHLGACTKTTERDADYLYNNNVNYSTSIAMWGAESDVRVIYASSAASYGLGELGYSDSIVDELKPLNAYGFSKHEFDRWVLRNTDMVKNIVGLKFFNVFGPNEYHKGDMASMVYKAYNQIKQTGKVNLFKSYTPEYSDGGQMRDFIYVDDVVNVLYALMDKADVRGIYNLGTGKARSWNDLMMSVFSAMNIEPSIQYVDMPDSLVNQYQNFTQADMSKWDNTGINVHFPSLEESVTDYVHQYLMKQWQNR